MTRTRKAGKTSGIRKRKYDTGQRRCARKRKPGHVGLGNGAFSMNASGKARTEAEARKVVESLAETKQAVLKLLAEAVNRHKPARAPMVFLDCLKGPDLPGEFRWEAHGWSVQLHLQPGKPIEILWAPPEESMFYLMPTGYRVYAESADSP